MYNKINRGRVIRNLVKSMNVNEFERTKPVVTMHKINSLLERIEEERVKTEILYKDRTRSLDEIKNLLQDVKESFKKGE
jgi:oligoribonuclease NrnB/cAMP/cGMP phosphodiesterase (DHH superfamily)